MRIRDKDCVYEAEKIIAKGNVLTIFHGRERTKYDIFGIMDDDILDHALRNGFLNISDLNKWTEEKPMRMTMKWSEDRNELPFV